MTTTLNIRNYRAVMRGSEFRIMRLQECSEDHGDRQMDTSQQTVKYLRSMLPASMAWRPDVENFGVVHLTTQRKTIGLEIISNGTLNQLLVHSREVFKGAIISNAASIILFHNHPSGDPTPSDADIKVTRDMMRAGQLLKIEVLDHIILGLPSERRPSGFVSIRELGYFSS